MPPLPLRAVKGVLHALRGYCNPFAAVVGYIQIQYGIKFGAEESASMYQSYLYTTSPDVLSAMVVTAAVVYLLVWLYNAAG